MPALIHWAGAGRARRLELQSFLAREFTPRKLKTLCQSVETAFAALQPDMLAAVKAALGSAAAGDAEQRQAVEVRQRHGACEALDRRSGSQSAERHER